MSLGAMALRNLGRRRGRTALTATMIAGGTALAVITVGMTDGTYALMTRLATESSTGQLQVVRRGYDDRPSLQKTLEDPEAARRALAADPRVAGVTARVEGGGLLAAGTRTVGAALVGVEPEGEREVTTLAASVSQGSWLPEQGAEEKPAVLTTALARQLRVKVGDEIAFVGQAADGSMASDLLRVRGLVGQEGEDGPPVAFLRLADARELLVLPGRLHRLLASVPDLRDVDAVARGLVLPAGDEARTWEQLVPGLARTIASDRAGAWVMILVILAVVLLGVANTLLMSVLERTHELGVLAAVGTRPGQLVSLVLGEAFFLALGAALLGAAIGSGVNAWIARVGIPLGDATIAYGGVVVDRMVCQVDLPRAAAIAAFVLAAAVLAAIFPAARAARLSPVEALRS